ncbi:MAG: tetratricopeptide repeat protein [bacterium]|nr:tetratricopeptide repeat protein [bacterium]
MTLRSAVISAFALFLTVVGGVGSVAAQDEPRVTSREAIALPQPQDRRIKLARRLIRAKQYDNASNMLETLYEENPADEAVQNLLRSCYDILGQYAKAELLVRKFIEREPGNPGHYTYLAELLAKMGQNEESAQAYGKAIDLMPLDDLAVQASLIRSMMSCGQNDLALERIGLVRQDSSRSAAFALERGIMLEGNRDYRTATEEYLSIIDADTTRQAGQAERRLMALLEFAGSSEEVEKVLMNLADTTAGERTLNLLADFYIKSNRFENAFDYALMQDSLAGFDGQPLLNFLRQCRDRKSWAQVARMADYYLEKNPGSPYATEVSGQQADALARLGRPHEAVVAYERVFAGAAQPRTKGDALFGIGQVYFEYLRDFAKARLYFDSVVSHYPRGFSFLNARKNIPHCYLREGDLTMARREFAVLEGKRQLDNIQEEIAYYLALTAFFEKKYDSAEVGFRKLMVDYPRGYYVNDALALVLLIDEAQEDKGLLYDFSNALYFQEQGRPDSTRAKLTAIAEATNPALADVALFRLAQLDLEAKDSTAALSTIDRLLADFPESYYLPYGMKIKADMIFDGDPAAEEARLLYRRLLESFPDYPFASEVREKLRRLEKENSVG